MQLLFDENLPRNLAAGLNILEESNHRSKHTVTVTHTKDLGISDYKDEEIIKLAGDLNAIIVTSDKDFKHFKHYKELYKQYNVGVILYKAFNNQDRYWDKVIALVTHWEKIKKMANDTDRPFVIKIDIKGVSLQSI